MDGTIVLCIIFFVFIFLCGAIFVCDVIEKERQESTPEHIAERKISKIYVDSDTKNLLIQYLKEKKNSNDNLASIILGSGDSSAYNRIKSKSNTYQEVINFIEEDL